MAVETAGGVDVVGVKARIFLVDDVPVTRSGLTGILRAQADLEVCGEASSASDALSSLMTAKPQLVILELAIDHLDGLDLVKQIKSRGPEDVRILVFSSCDELAYAPRALRAGASGYVTKSAPAETILAAVRKVLAGKVHVSERVASHLLQRLTGDGEFLHQSPLDQLTDRELQVFRCIAQGMSVREIAGQLYLSVKTIEAHRDHIKQKMRFGSAGELRRYAIQHRGVED